MKIMKFFKRNRKKIIGAAIIIFIILALLSIRKTPERVEYGVSFSLFHSNELGLDWQKVYNAILDDLGVRRFRLSAHWQLTEPKNDQYDWYPLDYQIKRAEETNSKVIFAVGRRLPGWPECHEPSWAKDLSDEDKREELLEYMTTVVNRYKNSSAIAYWQIENEPFLTFFAREHCQDFLDKEFLKKEINLVRSLDPSRTILVTDSGELGLWYKAYQLGDSFGTSLYLYVWNHTLGPVRYPVPPAFFKIKRNIVEMLFNNSPDGRNAGRTPETLLIELSAEPWLLKPIKDTPLETALSRMDVDKFNNVLEFAQKAGFEKQYLWGAEWWYYMMKEKNHPEFWERAKKIDWQ